MVATTLTSNKPNADVQGTKKPIWPLNPRTTHYEFFGPAGAIIVMLGMPATVVGLYGVCNAYGCPPTLEHLLYNLCSFNWTDMSIYAMWIVWCVACHYMLPGVSKKGVLLRNGQQLEYKLSAFSTFLFTLGAFSLIINFHGLDLLIYVADHFLSLATAGIVFATTMSIYLYARSFAAERRGKLLALGGNSGNVLYDFFIGRELNPRIFNGSLDLKSFAELRPGLIGWMVLNFAFMAKQYTLLGRVTDSMLLVVIFQSVYVIDALYNEVSLLTTMDITTDGFGFMLCFGDIVWVPFSYSLQARYLSLYPTDLGIWAVIGILLVNLVGFYIFRSANTQKDTFRTNPEDDCVKQSGSKLLISGWWGTARHINYFGDWIMSIAWCLPCGFTHFPIPYFYPIFFAILLVHRFHRDEHKCRLKYGEDWTKYCKIVKWKIIPGIF